MKKVAEKVNDAQRQFDSMHEMMKVQNSMDLFEVGYITALGARSFRMLHPMNNASMLVKFNRDQT